MEIFLFSIFSALIIYTTVRSLIKVYNTALKRDEISKRKHRFLITISTLAGFFIATLLPLGYLSLF